MGGAAFSLLTRKWGARSRRSLCVSFAVQGLLIVIATCLIQADVVQQQEKGGAITFQKPLLSLIPISLLAIQSAGTINSTRTLGYNEMPGVVLTSVYYDIASDPAFLTYRNIKRNRRVMGAVMLLLGAIAGGWLNRSKGGMALVLWIAAFLKLAISVSWLFWSADGNSTTQSMA